jgi:hypothetical protein
MEIPPPKIGDLFVQKQPSFEKMAVFNQPTAIVMSGYTHLKKDTAETDGLCEYFDGGRFIYGNPLD